MHFEVVFVQESFNYIQDQMNTLLFRDSSNERKHRDILLQFRTFEVLCLDLSFGIIVIAWGFCLKDMHPLRFSYTVGEGEGVGILP